MECSFIVNEYRKIPKSYPTVPDEIEDGSPVHDAIEDKVEEEFEDEFVDVVKHKVEDEVEDVQPDCENNTRGCPEYSTI